MDDAVECENLTKHFRTREGVLVPAVGGVTLRVPRGQLLGVLGPNGAGKTTLLRMIHAFWPPTGGRLRVLGLDPTTQGKELKARLGVAPQEDNLDPDFSVLRNLTTFARYFRIPRGDARRRAEELLAFVGLSEKAREPIQNLSGGMKRRLILARSLVNEPELILLDEPTTGLDPQARHLVWDKVRELRRSGKTLLLTTHYMEEAEQLCDDVVIMDEGRILVRGSPPDLVRRFAAREVLELVFRPGHAPDPGAIRGLPGFDSGRVEIVGQRAYVYVHDAEALLHRAKERLPIAESIVRRGTLEDVFLQLTGRKLRE